MTGRLVGKVAYVTGAGGGIGQAVCREFLAQGARVVAADIDLEAATAATSTAASGRALTIKCDAGDSDSVRESVARSVAEFGRLDVLCNTAGGSSSQDGIVTEAAEEEFWRVIRLDLFGTFLSCRYGIPELIRAGGGSVINLTSMGSLVALPERDCYTAAKGGVSALTRSMAANYAEHGVRVNAIAPGITLSPRVAGRTREGRTLDLANRHLLGLVQPVDVAHMAVYLASDESRVVTGQILSVDSGVTIT